MEPPVFRPAASAEETVGAAESKSRGLKTAGSAEKPDRAAGLRAGGLRLLHSPTMKLPMVVSPATWDLIERLRPELDVFVDVFDATLASLLPEASHELAQSLRAAMEDRRPEGGRDRLLSAIRTGRHAVFTAEGLRIGLFPIRYHRDVIGVLAAAAPSRSGEAGETAEAGPASADAVDRRIERIGWTLRATLEADIALWEKLDHAEHRARWADGVLRFLSYLHTCGSEAELFAAVVQAAAVWGDFDARVYRRTLCGRYVVDAALPSANGFEGPESFDAALVDGRSAPVHVTSIAEMEQMGWRAAAGEITLLPLGTSLQPSSWLLAIAGNADARLSLAFEMLARTVAVRLDELLLARLDRLGDRLRQGLASAPATVPATAAMLLREFSAALPAGQARLLVADPVSGALRPIASVGATLFGGAPAPAEVRRYVAADRLLFPLAVDPGMPAVLDLSAPIGAPFSLADAEVAERAARWFEAWLAGAWRGLAGAPLPFAEFVTTEPLPVEGAFERTAANAW